MERLKRKYRSYKRAYLMQNKRKEKLYDILFSIDYNVDSSRGKFVADLSFTFLHWKLIDDLEAEKLSLEDIDEMMLKQMCYNILPLCETILHKIVLNGAMVRQLYEISRPSGSEGFEIPLIPDIKERTALSLCVKQKEFNTAEIIIGNLANEQIGHHARFISNDIDNLVKEGIPSVGKYLDARFKQTK